MAKYSYEFKKKVVTAYLNGKGGYKYLANYTPRCKRFQVANVKKISMFMDRFCEI